VMVLCKLNGHPDLACAESSCGLALAAVVPDHHAKRGDVQSIPRCHVRSQPQAPTCSFRFAKPHKRSGVAPAACRQKLDDTTFGKM
jgi:hypothetical protein